MHDEALERNRLRRERERLSRQIAALVDDDERVKENTDPTTRLQHYENLEQHEREIQIFRADLARFRDRHGPLGVSDSDRSSASGIDD